MISVIVINYNTEPLIEKLLDSLWVYTHTFQEIIIWDNCSTEPQNFNKEIYKDNRIQVIYSDVNLGFGQACNRAIASSKGSTLFIINPDVELIDVDFLEIQSLLNSRKIGLCGVLQLNSDSAIVTSSRLFPSISELFMELFFLNAVRDRIVKNTYKFVSDKNHLMEVDVVSGAFLAIRKELFVDIGGFDPDYFLYVEETDLAYRLKRKGYKNCLVTNQTILHHQGKSHNNYEFEALNIAKNQDLFIKKHYGVLYLYIFRFLNYVNKSIRFTLYLIFGKIANNPFLIEKALVFKKTSKSNYFMNK